MTGDNQAIGYNVAIHPVQSSGLCWRAVMVRHLGVGENGGRHNIFINVWGENGEERRDVKIAYTWAGKHDDEFARPVDLEKPAGEIGMGDIPIDKGQVISCWVQDVLPSDIVAGMHTAWPDEGPDVRIGHHSYVVEFHLVAMDIEPVPPAPPAPGPGPVVPPAGTEEILKWLIDIRSQLDSVIDMLAPRDIGGPGAYGD